MASQKLHQHPEYDDEEYVNGEAFAANVGRHLQELQRLSAFQQVATKVPPADDGRSSWFVYEDAIDVKQQIAAIHKRLLDREKLKDKVTGVQYFKSYLRPLFVKGASNVFLYRFQQFMTLHRGNSDMLRLKRQHSLTIPIPENLVALMFVSMADLTGNAGRRTFLVLDEGYLDNSAGFWVEDEEDGAEGFLELEEDTFWVYDDDSAAWFQRRFQGRKMKRGKGGGKRKGKGKGRGGRCFFRKRKGKSHLAEDQSDASQAWDWQDGWDEDWSWQDAAEESYAAKGQSKKGKKGKGKGKWSKDG
ncbi:unnamed protein product [Symbiodinium sp. KB8]|nr:unnamed protein product [Symbiodinium sp. KB8]